MIVKTKVDNQEKILFKTNDNLDLYTTIKFKGKYYRAYMYRITENELVVEQVELNYLNIDHQESEDCIKCPLCGEFDYDSWERDDHDKEYLCVCGATLEYHAEITKTYYTKIKKLPIIKSYGENNISIDSIIFEPISSKKIDQHINEKHDYRNF